jgi:hypothetical protein
MAAPLWLVGLEAGRRKSRLREVEKGGRVVLEPELAPVQERVRELVRGLEQGLVLV